MSTRPKTTRQGCPEWLTQAATDVQKNQVQTAYVHYLRCFGLRPGAKSQSPVTLRELHVKLSELYPRWKQLPRNEMVTTHQCLNQLNSHLSRWKRKSEDVISFYYANLTEDTESDVDDEPSHPAPKQIFWRETPKED